MDIKSREAYQTANSKALQRALEASVSSPSEAVLVDGLKSILKLSDARSRMYGRDMYGKLAQETLIKWSNDARPS